MPKKEVLLRLCILYSLLDNIVEQTGKYHWYKQQILDILTEEAKYRPDTIVKFAKKFEKNIGKGALIDFSEPESDAILSIIIDNLVALIENSKLEEDKITLLNKILSNLLNYWKKQFKGNEDKGFALMDKILEALL
ncbi:MAG: hypothetical protein AB7D38_12065 [Sulfurimonas sp.]|uniref:hypothetical protein n=1 Tax=Sulfurimonas sp. TaxID=2022749 RepID=UPI003D0C985D